MRNLGVAMCAGGLALVGVAGCAANTDTGSSTGNGVAGASPSSAGSSGSAMAGATAIGGAPGAAGAASSNAGATAAGTGSGGASAGSPGAAGATASAGSGGSGAVSAAGTAKVDIMAFSLTGCTTSVNTVDLAAKDNGLSAPKPTQSFAAGTFTVDYAVSGQYGQVGIDLPAATDLTGCTLSATLKGSSWPACGVYAVPFFFDGTLGTVAPFDAGEGRFVGEEVSNLPGPATINFKANGRPTDEGRSHRHQPVQLRRQRHGRRSVGREMTPREVSMINADATSLRSALLACMLLLSAACSTTPNTLFQPSTAGAGGDGAGTTGVAGSGAVHSSAGGALSLEPLPDAGSGHDPTQKCAPVPVGVVRDFRADGTPNGHPDFEKQTLFTKMDYDPMLGYPEQGITLPTLGADSKPQFSGGTFKTVTSGITFDQWFRDVPNVNTTIQYTLPLTLDAITNTLVFDTNAFFPIDDQGFGNSGHDDEGKLHNFGFTFELHMKFVYAGGEVFRFRGDDDMFVFIDGKRVIDLGGVHAKMEASVELDSLGLTLNEEYPIDIFQAERHTTQSNFRIETSLAFSNCDPIIIPK